MALEGSSSPCFSFWFYFFPSFFVFFCFIFRSFSYTYNCTFGCTRRFRHCMPLHSTPYCSFGVGHRHLQFHPPPHAWGRPRTHLSARGSSTRLSFCSSPSEDGEAQFGFVVCVSLILVLNLFFFISIFSGSKLLAWSNVIYFLSCMFKVQNESPIHVLTTDMFFSPSTTFELPSYVVGLANLLAEAPSPPPIQLPYLSLSPPCSASMSRKSNTNLLKGLVRRRGGDGASAKRCASLAV